MRSRKLNILFISPFYRPIAVGGAEISTEQYAQALSALGHNVIVMTPNFGSHKEKLQKQGKVKVYRFPFRPPASKAFMAFTLPMVQARIAGRIRKAIKRFRIDVVHVQGIGLVVAGIRAAKKEGKASVVTLRDYGFTHNFSVHTSYTFEMNESGYIKSLYSRCKKSIAGTLAFPALYLALRGELWMRRRALRKASKILCVSDFISKEAGKSLGVPTQTLYNLLPEFQASGGKPRKKSFVYVGNLSELKGISILLKAMKKVNGNLTVVGNTNLEHYKSLARELGVSEKAKFLGKIPNKKLPKIYASHEFIVLPSIRAEPLSRILIEASIVGKPVVATRVGGNPEVVNSSTGILCSPNPNSLAKAINQMLRKPKARLSQNMGKRKKLFDKENAKRLVGIYNDLLFKKEGQSRKERTRFLDTGRS